MITDISNIDKIIGNMIVKQSNLSRENILNGRSVRGIDLAKFIADKILSSYELTDSVIIFTTNASNAINVTEVQKDESIYEAMSFEVQFTIYGNQSLYLAKILKARFESEKVRNDLLEQGIYVIDIDSIQSMNEFMNETVWSRADMTLNIGCEMKVTQIDAMNEIKHANVEVEK